MLYLLFCPCIFADFKSVLLGALVLRLGSKPHPSAQRAPLDAYKEEVISLLLDFGCDRYRRPVRRF